MLSFVPPDGHFKLMEYRFAPTSSSMTHQVAVPLALRPTVKLEDNGGTLQQQIITCMRPYNEAGSIEITLVSRQTTKTMENVTVELHLGEGASSASCIASHGASWSFNPRTLVRSWLCRTVPSDCVTDIDLGAQSCCPINVLQPSRVVQFDVSHRYY